MHPFLITPSALYIGQKGQTAFKRINGHTVNLTSAMAIHKLLFQNISIYPNTLEMILKQLLWGGGDKSTKQDLKVKPLRHIESLETHLKELNINQGFLTHYQV